MVPYRYQVVGIYLTIWPGRFVRNLDGRLRQSERIGMRIGVIAAIGGIALVAVAAALIIPEMVADEPTVTTGPPRSSRTAAPTRSNQAQPGNRSRSDAPPQARNTPLGRSMLQTNTALASTETAHTPREVFRADRPNLYSDDAKPNRRNPSSNRPRTNSRPRPNRETNQQLSTVNKNPSRLSPEERLQRQRKATDRAKQIRDQQRRQQIGRASCRERV